MSNLNYKVVRVQVTAYCYSIFAQCQVTLIIRFTLGKLPEMNSRRAFIVILLVYILFTYIHQQQFNVRKNYMAYYYTAVKTFKEYYQKIHHELHLRGSRLLKRMTTKSDEFSISVQKKGKESKSFKPKCQMYLRIMMNVSFRVYHNILLRILSQFPGLINESESFGLVPQSEVFSYF